MAQSGGDLVRDDYQPVHPAPEHHYFRARPHHRIDSYIEALQPACTPFTWTYRDVRKRINYVPFFPFQRRTLGSPELHFFKNYRSNIPCMAVSPAPTFRCRRGEVSSTWHEKISGGKSSLKAAGAMHRFNDLLRNAEFEISLSFWECKLRDLSTLEKSCRGFFSHDK